MAQINQYPTREVINGSELLVCFDVSNSDTRKFSVSALSTYIAGLVSSNMSGYVTQYAAPSATSFSINITEAQSNTHLIITPTAAFANGTIIMPLSSTALDGQRLLVNCTQAVTSIVFSLNGATSITGAPTALAANGFFTLKYDRLTSTWYRVG